MLFVHVCLVQRDGFSGEFCVYDIRLDKIGAISLVHLRFANAQMHRAMAQSSVNHSLHVARLMERVRYR